MMGAGCRNRTCTAMGRVRGGTSTATPLYGDGLLQ